MTTPKLRFKGYNDKWKSKIIENFTESYSGGTPTANNKKYYNGDIPFIRSSEIDSKITKLHVNKEALNNSSAKMVHVGDILYALYGANSGQVAISKIDGAINQAILAIRTNDNTSNEFLCDIFKKNKDKIVNKFIQGGQGNLSSKIIKKLNFKFPELNEQKKIGAFLYKIDKLIDIQNRKIEKLNYIKHGYLQKSFVKPGEKIPRLRFNGFTEVWDKKRLIDFSKKETKKNSELSYNEVLTNSALHGVIDQSTFFKKEIANPGNIDKYTVVQKDVYIYNPRISKYAEFGPIKRNKLGKVGIASPMYFVFKITNSEISKLFLDNYFNSNHWYKYVYSIGNSGARSDRIAIKDDDFMNMPIPVPNYQEQQKIGKLLYTVDNQINLQKKELSLLKLIKKGYLQKMFA